MSNEELDEYIKNVTESIELTDNQAKAFLDLASKMRDGKVTIISTDDAMVAYATSLRKVDTANKITTTSTRILKGAMQALSKVGWMIVISLVIEGISRLVDWIKSLNPSIEELTERMKESTNTIKSIRNEFDSLNKTISKSVDRFAELSQGVNQLTGENKSLSTEEYEEFLELSKQLADSFSSLPVIYDKNGNAIVQLSGDVDTITGSLQQLLDVERQLTKQKIADELPDLYETTKENVDKRNEDIEDYKNKLFNAEQQQKRLLEFYDRLNDTNDEAINSIFEEAEQDGVHLDRTEAKEDIDKFLEDRYLKISEISGDATEKNVKSYVYQSLLQELGVNYTISDDLIAITSDDLIAMTTDKLDSNNFISSEKELQKIINEAKSEISSLELLNKSDWTNLSSNLITSFELDDSYKILSDNMALGFQNVINNLNYDDLDYENFEGLKDHIYKEILFPLSSNDEKYSIFQNLFEQVMSFEDGDLRVLEFAEQLQSEIDKLELEIDITPIIANEQDLKNKLSNSIAEIMKSTKTTNYGEYMMSQQEAKKLEEYTKDFTEEEIDLWIESTKYAKTAEEAIKMYEEAKKNILNTDNSSVPQLEKIQSLSKGLDQLNKIYTDVYNGESFDWSSILNNDDFKATFGNMTNVTDEYKTVYDDFINTITKNPDNINACKSAFDDLATAYIYNSEALDGLTGETEEATIAMLEQMGIVNARDIVERKLTENRINSGKIEQEYSKRHFKLLKDSTLDEINNFAKEEGYVDNLRYSLQLLTLQKKNLNSEKLDFTADLQSIADYIEGLGYAADGIRSYNSMKKELEDIENGDIYIPTDAREGMKSLLEEKKSPAEQEYDDALEGIKRKVEESVLGIDYDPNNSENSSKGTSDFDWIQTKLESISKVTDKLQKKFEKTFTVNSATKKFKQYLDQINSEITANKTAGQKYLGYFNSVDLSAEWKAKIKNGKYVIDKDINSDTIDKINEAQGYWDKYLKTLETVESLQEEIANGENTYASKIIDHYDKQIEKIQRFINLREKLVSVRSTWSIFDSASDYKYEQKKNVEQIKINKDAIKRYESLKQTVSVGSDAWNTYNEKIQSCTDNIYDLVSSNAELSKSIMNIPLDDAEKKIEKYSNSLSLLQSKYESLNTYDAKNKNINQQQLEAWRTKEANQVALDEANKNVSNAWNNVIKTASKTFQSNNKGKKEGEYLSTKGLDISSDAYKSIVEYNNALRAQKDATDKAKASIAEYTRTTQENTKKRWDNIISQYQGSYNYYNEKVSVADAYLNYRDAKGYSNTNDYEKSAYQNKLNAQNLALSELKAERSKLDWKKIQEDYLSGKLQREDYLDLIETIRQLDSSIYETETSIIETTEAINKIPFQKLEYEIGVLTNKQKELSDELSLKQKLNQQINTSDYTNQIDINNRMIEKYEDENKWLQKQLESVSVNSDKWKEWSDQIASNTSEINSLKESNEELKDSLRSDVYIKPFDKLATAIDFVKERFSSFIGLVNDSETMFDDKGVFTKNGEAALGLSLKNIEVAKASIENIQNKIKEAQDLYNNGNNEVGYSAEEYSEDMRQYISDMWNAVSESKSASDEIINIYQQQGQAILDALNKEIDARSEALQKKKEYYDYDKTIKTKTKDIQSLETQIAAMQSMEDSLDKRKKLLELQEELNEKQEDLKDTQLDHQINLVVNGLDDFSVEIQENFDNSIKELKTNLDKQAEIINEANSLYADSYNSIFEHLSKIMKYYGIDVSNLPSDLKDTTIGDLKGFSSGGVARELSGVIKKNGDNLLASINPNETVLTERFTELMPHAVDIMEGLVKTPIIPTSSLMVQPSVNVEFNIDGNVDNTTWAIIKKEIPNISKQVQKDIYTDLKKSGALRK